MTGPAIIEAFVERATHGSSSDLDRRRAMFVAVRDLPYATNAAYDAEALLSMGAGNCVAKSALLQRSFGVLGIETRLARWSYRLRDPFVHLIPVTEDVHTVVQVCLDGGWRTLDPAHDHRLPAPPFVVAEWDGYSDTDFAYPPLSEPWISGLNDAEIDAKVREISRALEGHDTREYSKAFNAWLEHSRSESQVHHPDGYRIELIERSD